LATNQFLKNYHKGKYVCIPFDIQRLKLDVAKSHYENAIITYNYLVFPTNLGNISYENYLLKERPILDTNANISTSSKDFQQIAWANDFLYSTSPYFQERFFATYGPFGKVIW
jgi:hypothetical protein